MNKCYCFGDVTRRPETGINQLTVDESHTTNRNLGTLQPVGRHPIDRTRIAVNWLKQIFLLVFSVRLKITIPVHSTKANWIIFMIKGLTG